MSRKGLFFNVLVPLDGSGSAEQAVSVGGSLARRSGAALHLASVEAPLPALLLSPAWPEAAAGVELATRAHVTEYLDSTAQMIGNVPGGTVDTTVLQGPIAPALSRYAETNAIDLIVMTTRGRGEVSRWCVGSVADQLLRQTTVPVLLLHPRELPQPTEFRRILIALDGEIEDPVLEPAIALGSLDPATRYVLARVVEPTTPLPSELAAHSGHPGPDQDVWLQIKARDYLAHLSERLRAQGLRVTYQVVVGRGIAAQVLELATALGADCIAVGTHGKTGAERALLGSVAEKIVRGAEIPVLIGPARQPAAQPASARSISSVASQLV